MTLNQGQVRALSNLLGWHESLKSLLGHLWLDPGVQKTDAVCDLLKPFGPALMRRYEVSKRVNLVKNDDAACAEATGRESPASVLTYCTSRRTLLRCCFRFASLGTRLLKKS
jgi:hypothetical protein